jgi:peptidoglycan hydrolase-like protein with peptidoglycan-binding domain
VRAAASRAVPLVAVLAAAVPTPQASARELGERRLERGGRGDDVRPLQELLARLDVDTEADGVFGDGTVATACHRHFEQWTSPGWHRGGHAEDPRPLLTALEQA